MFVLKNDFFSLPNKSDIIRWSLDLRWQNPKMDNGFYGLKDSVVMRTSDDPNHKIDWTDMAGIDRTKKQMAETVSEMLQESVDLRLCVERMSPAVGNVFAIAFYRFVKRCQ